MHPAGIKSPEPLAGYCIEATRPWLLSGTANDRRMPEEQDPPRKFYDLKEAQFDAVNARSDHHPSIDVKDLFKQATAPGSFPSASPAPAADARPRPDPAAGLISGIPVRPKPADESDVHGILRDNLARANAAGLNELEEKPLRTSRRKRDYWFLMITGNGVLAALFAGAVVSRNAFLMAFSAAGIGLISAGLTWVMWFVMDDY
jgi:hypothetical protein